MSSQMFAQQSPVRQYLPWICTSLAIGYAAYIHWRSRCQRKKIQINSDKKHARSCEVNIDDIDRNQTKKKISYCRCWKSETFPLCDGGHKCHNRENDDSVGPLNLVWRDDNVVESGDATTTQAATDPTRQTESKSPINDPDMDIKSIDSLESDHSPILGVSGSANGSNGSDDFDDQLVKIDSNAAAGSSSSSNNKNNADVTTTTSTPNRSSNMNDDDGHHNNNTNNNSNNLTDEQLSSLEMIDDDNNFTTVNNDNDGQQQQSTP